MAAAYESDKPCDSPLDFSVSPMTCDRLGPAKRVARAIATILADELVEATQKGIFADVAEAEGVADSDATPSDTDGQTGAQNGGGGTGPETGAAPGAAQCRGCCTARSADGTSRTRSADCPGSN